MSKGRLSEREQSHAFERAFSPDLASRLHQRLQVKFPDHHPDDHYTLLEIYEAATFALRGSAPSIPLASTIPPASKVEEHFALIMENSRAYSCKP